MYNNIRYLHVVGNLCQIIHVFWVKKSSDLLSICYSGRLQQHEDLQPLSSESSQSDLYERYVYIFYRGAIKYAIHVYVSHASSSILSFLGLLQPARVIRLHCICNVYPLLIVLL